jgi:HEAT repeat protein
MATSVDQANLSRLLEELESPDEPVRRAALKRLGGATGPQVRETLRRLAAADSSAAIRFEARRLLSVASERAAPAPEARTTGSIDRFQALLADPEPAVRVRVIRSLERNPDPKVAELLSSALPRERDAGVLSALMPTLAAAAGMASLPHLMPFLKAQDPRVRVAAIEALGTLRDRPTQERLLSFFDDPDRRVRVAVACAVKDEDPALLTAWADSRLDGPDEQQVRAALYVLRFVGEEAALKRLEPKLETAPPTLKAAVIASLTFLARKGSARAGELLLRVNTPTLNSSPRDVSAAFYLPNPASVESRLESADAELRLAAAREAALGERRELLPQLRATLDTERNTRVAATLVSAIGRLGDEDDVSRLQLFLSAQDPRLRANAVRGLGQLAGEQRVELLRAMLDDPSPRVRSKAIVALHGAPGVDVLPVLRGMALNEGEGFGLSAIWAAATLGTAEGVAVLAEMAGSSHADLSKRARVALQALASESEAAARALEELGPADGSGRLADTKLERLLFDLRHENTEIRLATLRKAAELKDGRLLQPVREQLHDADPIVRNEARKTVRTLLGSVPERRDATALASFESELVGDEEAARQALGAVLDVALRCGISATASALGRRLPVEDRPFVRANLLSALALIGDTSTSKLIQAFVRDPDARVRANAVDALEMTGNEEDLLAAITCLLDTDPRVRAAAIRAAASIDREIFLDHLRSMLGSQTIADRAAGLYVIRTVNAPERFDLLKQHFQQETQPRLYEICAEVLAAEGRGERARELQELVTQLPDGTKRDTLQAALKETGRSLLAQAAAPAGGEDDPEAPLDLSSSFSRIYDLKRLGELKAESLRSALRRETDPLTISCLLEAAAEMELPDTLELAQPFSHSKDRRVRLAVAEAVGKLPMAQARDCLALLVRDRDLEVARRALEVLARAVPGSGNPAGGSGAQGVSSTDRDGAPTGLEAAVAAIQSVAELGEPWAIKRALELLAALDSPRGLPLVLQLVASGKAGQGALHQVQRLLASQGTVDTLDRVASMYRAAPASGRSLFLELGTALGEALRIGPDEMAARFPDEPGPPAAQASPMASSTRASRAKTQVRLPPSEPRRLDLRLVAAGAGLLGLVGVAVVGLWMLRPGSPAGGPAEVEEPVVNVASRPARGSIRFQAPVKQQPLEFASSASMPDGLPAADTPPSLQEIEDSLKRAFAPMGIKSQALIHLIAVDRVQDGYRIEINRARDLFKKGDLDGALRLLEAALAALDPEHLHGRLAVLRALEATCRLGQRFERIADWRAQMKEIQRKIMEMVIQAGRDGGLPEEQVKQALKNLDEAEQRQGQLGTAADFFAGAELAKDAGDKQ